MHFKQPKLFIMWDTDIRRMHGLGSFTHDYTEFHKRMKLEFGHLAWSRQDRTFTKAIDEYNYLRANQCRLTLNQLSSSVFCLRTELVAQIEFTEWTPDGHLRHSKFVGLREDKAREVVRAG